MQKINKNNINVFLICVIVIIFAIALNKLVLRKYKECCGGYIDIQGCIELEDRFEKDSEFEGESFAKRSDCERLRKFDYCDGCPEGFTWMDGKDCFIYKFFYYYVYGPFF